jgi:hypothetical protein
MSIGSSPEVGVTFRRWGDMTPGEQRAWFEYLRTAPPVGSIVERTR